MSALTINKLACRAYAALCFLSASIILFGSAMCAYFIIVGLPDKVLAEFAAGIAAEKTLEGLTPDRLLAMGVVFLLVLALVPIVCGILACMRYVWAMIVGTTLWSAFFGLVIATGGISKLPENKFELISTGLLILLTVVAGVSRSRPAAANTVVAMASPVLA